MIFLQYLNSSHNNIEFTIEFEHHKEIPFFDILVKRGPNTIFMISVYPEKDIHKSFSILNGTLSLLANTKYILLNLIRTLNYRCYQICSSFSLLQSALGDLLKKTSSEWLPSRNNKLPRQWCVGAKPKQARCSCSYGSLEGSYYFVILFRSSKQPNF